jgi:hypothetical protein
MITQETKTNHSKEMKLMTFDLKDNKWYGFKIKKRNNRIKIIDMDINTEEKEEIQRTRQEQIHPDYC